LHAAEVGAAKTLAAIRRFVRLAPAATTAQELEVVRERVLRTAKAVGKARFAQILSKHVSLATDAPTYIADAAVWLMR